MEMNNENTCADYCAVLVCTGAAIHREPTSLPAISVGSAVRRVQPVPAELHAVLPVLGSNIRSAASLFSVWSISDNDHATAVCSDHSPAAAILKAVMLVTICYDHPQWAQAAHAEGLRKYAPPGMDVRTCLLGDYQHDGADVVYVINFASCRRYGPARVATCVASHAWMHELYNDGDWRTRGVNPRRNSTCGRKHLINADAVVCRNIALQKWASETHANAKYHPAGVDRDIFYPRGKPQPRRLKVGWSGQVNQSLEGHFKGYYEIWLPLKERLGKRYEFVENTRTADEALSWDEMSEWFASLDVFLTTATAEGTPNGPMNAAACGAVVLATDVGQLSDWKVLRDTSMLVPSYGNKTEAELVIRQMERRLGLLENHVLRWNISERLLESIEREYDYRVLAPKILEFVCGVNA